MTRSLQDAHRGEDVPEDDAVARYSLPNPYGCGNETVTYDPCPPDLEYEEG